MKRRTRFGKLGMLVFALVLALGGLGVGYATWTDTVVVEESVTTGSVCVELVKPLTITDHLGPPAFPIFPTSFPDLTCDPITLDNVRDVVPPKNVGWGEGGFLDTDGDGIDDKVWITLHNVYPCYYNHADVWIHNCGTIPVILTKITLFDGTTTQEITANDVFYLDLNGNGETDFEIKWGDTIGQQFDPCYDADVSFGMHFVQDDVGPDMQGQSFTFYLTFHFVQWNKA